MTSEKADGPINKLQTEAPVRKAQLPLSWCWGKKKKKTKNFSESTTK